jgi:hypothetical protein
MMLAGEQLSLELFEEALIGEEELDPEDEELEPVD